jgi:hypothetical protein
MLTRHDIVIIGELMCRKLLSLRCQDLGAMLHALLKSNRHVTGTDNVTHFDIQYETINYTFPEKMTSYVHGECLTVRVYFDHLISNGQVLIGLAGGEDYFNFGRCYSERPS